MRRAVLAVLAAPVLLAVVQPAFATPTAPPDPREVIREQAADDCLQQFLIRPARSYEFAKVDSEGNVEVYPQNVAGAATNEAGYAVRYAQCKAAG